MTATATTWDVLFGGDTSQIFKGQFGFAGFRDYDPTKPLTNWTPFITSTGDWSTSLDDPAGDNFSMIGYTDENALEFTPTMTTSDTRGWQARQKLLTDITEDSEMATLTAIQRTPLVEALESNIPLAAMGSLGQVGYQYTKPKFTYPVARQIIFGAVYASPLGLSLWARIYPLAYMIKPDKLGMNPKTEAQGKLQFDAMLDPISGFAVRTLREGPGWRALGGTTSTPGTVTATAGTSGSGNVTLTFTAPTSKNGPFTYNVFVDSTVTPIATSAITVGGTTSNPILTVSGQTTGSHTYKVQAVGSNMSGSVQTAPSNSVTLS